MPGYHHAERRGSFHGAVGQNERQQYINLDIVEFLHGRELPTLTPAQYWSDGLLLL